jgi:hypothetical protein
VTFGRREGIRIPAGDRRGDRGIALQRLEHLVAARLQRIGAQVERRPPGERLGFGKPRISKIRLEGRLDPFRNVALHMRGGIIEIAGMEGGEFFLGQGFRSKPVAVEFRGQRLGGEAPLAQEHRIAEGRRTFIIHQEGVRQFHAQRVIDDIADRGAVAGAGEPMGQAPVLERIGDGAPPRLDIRQNLDGSREPPTQSHPFTPFCVVVAAERAESKPARTDSGGDQPMTS